MVTQALCCYPATASGAMRKFMREVRAKIPQAREPYNATPVPRRWMLTCPVPVCDGHVKAF